MLEIKIGMEMSGLTYNDKIKDVDKWWEDDLLDEEDDGIKIYDLITYPSDFTISTILKS